jgi:hypothetical protein
MSLLLCCCGLLPPATYSLCPQVGYESSASPGPMDMLGPVRYRLHLSPAAGKRPAPPAAVPLCNEHALGQRAAARVQGGPYKHPAGH